MKECCENWSLSAFGIKPNDYVDLVFKQKNIMLKKLYELLSDDEMKVFLKKMAEETAIEREKVEPNRNKPQC